MPDQIQALAFFLLAIGSHTSRYPEAYANGPHALKRELQANNFRVTYLARFQHLLDPVCSGPNPTIQVYCYGDVTPVSISDGSIQCTRVSDGEWNGIQCENTCGVDSVDGTNCSQVYLEQVSVSAGVFGEIVFQCEGPNVTDVDAYMNYLGGEPGSCTAHTEFNSRNYHVAQLGVYCANQTAYVFDDKDFECGLGSSGANIDGIYTCLQGVNCVASNCTVEFDDLIIDADSHNFHECIESITDGVAVPSEPLQEDLVGPAPAGNYTTIFQANWQLQLNLDVCGGDFAKKRLTCTNGVITLVEGLAENVNCTKVDDDRLECEDTTAENFVNDFSGAMFQCDTVDAIPEAQVEYDSAKSICVSDVENTVKHLIRLGVACEDETNGNFTSFSDYLFECGNDNTYQIMDGRYTCVVANSLQNEERRPLGVASAHTDFRWSRGEYDICYKFVPDPEAVTAPPTSPPTDAPTPCEIGSGGGIGVNSGCTLETESEPTDSETNSPTVAPTSSGPTLAPTSETPAPSPAATIPIATPAPVETAPETPPPSRQPTCPKASANVVCSAEFTPVECGELNCQYDNQCNAELAGFESDDCTSLGPIPSDTLFFVDYVAKFKRVVDPGCDSPTYETLLLVCEKGQIINIETNSNAVQCTPPEDYEGSGEQSRCELDCDGTECDELYIDRQSIYFQGIWMLNDNYAEVTFRCQSDDVNGVDAAYLLSGSEETGLEGSCEAASQGSRQNVLLAQLNVLCPTGAGGMAYVNDDAFAECDVTILSIDINGNYTCLTGDFCGDTGCTVSYDDVVVQADHDRFRECIQTDNGYPAPKPEVLSVTQEVGQYNSHFRVGSEFWYDDDLCTGALTGIRITCADGTIELISSDASKDCQVVSDNEIECTETESSLVNEASDVAIYQCAASNKVPQTRVEYYSTSIACDSDSSEQATRYLNLGVKCGEAFISLDYFFECGKDNDYTTRTDDFRFTCYSRVQVPANSNNVVVEIPAVEAYTDYRYIFLASNRCYSYEPSATRTFDAELADTLKASLAKSAGGSSTSSRVASPSSSTGSEPLSSAPGPSAGKSAYDSAVTFPTLLGLAAVVIF